MNSGSLLVVLAVADALGRQLSRRSTVLRLVGVCQGVAGRHGLHGSHDNCSSQCKTDDGSSSHWKLSSRVVPSGATDLVIPAVRNWRDGAGLSIRPRSASMPSLSDSAHTHVSM